MTCLRKYRLGSLKLFCAIIVLALCGRKSTSLIQPENVALLKGDSTILQCSPGSTVLTSVYWLYIASNSSTLISITDWNRSTGKCIPLPSYPQYDVDATNTAQGQCDLKINNVTPSEAGWYQCTGTAMATGPYNYNSQVTVLYSNPTCSQNVTSNVTVNDAVSMKCSVNYTSYGVNATMEWLGCSYNNVSYSTYIVDDFVTTTEYTIYIVAQQQQQYLETCNCSTNTTNPPLPPPAFATVSPPGANNRYRSTWPSKPNIPVQYCPVNVTLSQPNSTILPLNTTITCRAVGYPTPNNYAIFVSQDGTNLTTAVSGQSVLLSSEGSFYVNCTATNHITSGQQGNFPCSRQSAIYVYNVSVDAVTTPTPTTPSPSAITTPNPCPTTCIILVVCLCVGIPLVVGVVVLVVCYLKPGCKLYNRCHQRDNGRAKSPSMESNGSSSQFQMNQSPPGSSPDGYRQSPLDNQAKSYGNPVADPNGIVYAELQPRVDNRAGSRQPLQFVDNNNEYGHVRSA